MSFQAVAWALDHSVAVGNDRLVMFALAHHCDDSGFAAESKATISREARMSDRTVQRSLQGLCELGEIERVTNATSPPPWWLSYPKNRRPTLYRLCAFLGSQRVSSQGSQPGTPIGETQGRNRGDSGVRVSPSDQGVRAVNLEELNSESSRFSDLPKTKAPWVELGISWQEYRESVLPEILDAMEDA